MGIVAKTRNGVAKHRMILDTNESGVKDASVKEQRAILPRLIYAVWRKLELMATGFGKLLCTKMSFATFAHK